MAYPRRRIHHLNRIFPAVSAISAAIFLLFVFISFDHIHHTTISNPFPNRITDAVVAARILNATLVVPKLDQKSFWKDVSNFSEIFDVDWFISYLEKDVKIIKELPQRRGQPWNPYTMRVPRKCNEHCYISRLLPVLTKKRAVQLTKFDYRLSNKLDLDLQRLRCRVNYHALRFTKPILEMGAELVRRMRMKSKHYIALHLRFPHTLIGSISSCFIFLASMAL